MAEVREPSPDDDDVLVLDGNGRVTERCVIHRARWFMNGWSPCADWDGLTASVGPLRVYVPQSRLAAVEAELAEARATIERVEALCDALDAADPVGQSWISGQVRAALAGPPAPKETP